MLVNISKNTVIAKKIRHCNSFLSKSIGLMFHKKIIDEAWVFQFRTKVRYSIHMFFVFFPIDILFLDKGDAVVGTVHSLKPFAVYSPRVPYFSFVELASGTLKRTGTEPGDCLAVESRPC
ncbi:MAG: DUF192 domain-containing protein [Candidatus Woesearchaeota archaeon]